MKNEIEKILAEYSDGKETLQEATTKVLRLFSVMQRSEQLVCDKCTDGLNKSKGFEKGTCVHCRKKI
jgi:hypothetical protein